MYYDPSPKTDSHYADSPKTDSHYVDSLKADSPNADSPNSDSPKVYIPNKEQKMTIIPYALFNTELAIVFCFYCLFIVHYFVESLLFLICPEYKIRKRKTLVFCIY